jgi:hypothetical protein
MLVSDSEFAGSVAMHDVRGSDGLEFFLGAFAAANVTAAGLELERITGDAGISSA